MGLLAPTLRLPTNAATANEAGMSEFNPDVAILPKAQRVLWPSLNEIPHGFVLYGVTCLGR